MRPISVLIVDDHEDTAFVTAFLLAQRGFTPSIAFTGKAALASVSQSHPDVILLDVMMPSMDGYEVLAHLKADPSACDIPVIFHTAGGSPADDDAAHEHGAAGVVSKGQTKPNELAAKLQASLVH